MNSRSSRTSDQFRPRSTDDNYVGSYRTALWLLRNLTAGYQYRNHYRYFSDGISDSENSNREAQAIHLKLDELIRVTKGARNVMLDLEHLDDEQLQRLREIYERFGTKARGDEKENT